MNYSFDIDLACRFGVDEAIMLQNIVFWLAKNRANGVWEYDGRTWTYNSIAAFQKLFPFWTEGQIRRILKSLIDKGVLMTGDYNEDRRCRRLWYALTDEYSFLTNAFAENDKCICRNQQMHLQKSTNDIYVTDINTDIKADNTLFSLHSNSVKAKGEKSCLFANSCVADFDKFAEHFSGEEFNGIDIGFYYHQIKDWSAAGGKKKRDWVATARNWIRSDIQAGKVKRLSNTGDLARQYMEDRKQWLI